MPHDKTRDALCRLRICQHVSTSSRHGWGACPGELRTLVQSINANPLLKAFPFPLNADVMARRKRPSFPHETNLATNRKNGKWHHGQQTRNTRDDGWSAI